MDLEEENRRLRAEIKQLRAASGRDPSDRLSTLRSASDPLTSSEISQYARQMTLPGFGAEAQKRLRASSALVVGAGGLGSPIILYLAGAGVGRLGICDGDVVEVGNLHRQVVHDAQRAGVNKAVSAKWTADRLNPAIDVVAYPFRVGPENAVRIISLYDVVVDATDSVAVRYVLSDACVVAGKPFVSAAALRADGQVTVYNFHGGPCYRCLNPVPPPPDSVLKADAAGVLGSLVGVIGCIEATEVIKVLAGLGTPLVSRMLFYNGFGATSRVAKVRGKQPGCLACGEQAKIRDPATFDYAAFCGAPTSPNDDQCKEFGTTCEALKAALDRRDPVLVIDVRSASEHSFCPFGNGSSSSVISIPFAGIGERVEEVKAKVAAGTQQQAVVVLCRKGWDSFRAARLLRQSGVPGATFVIGGLLKWASTVDHAFPIY